MANKPPSALAAQLHDNAVVYLLCGAIDGLNLNSSMTKCLFDFLCTTGEISSADAMHDWMMTQEGMETVAATSVSLIVFSMLANYFRDDDKNSFKRYMAVVWPYCRDSMKGLKNAYKGVRSAFIAFELLSLGQDLHHLIVPVGLLLGGLSILNRIWFRIMIGSDRKDMMRENLALYHAIQHDRPLSSEEISAKCREIKRHSAQLRAMALFSAAYGGIVDGLYLYVGVLGICSFAPAVLQAMSIFCAIYFVTCVVTRIYEEYNFQRLLRITEVRVELALQSKGIELLVSQLELVNAEISKAGVEEVETLVAKRKKLAESLTLAVDNFKNKREELRSLSTLSYPAAVLAGLGNGLAVYGVLAGSMFAISSLLLLSSIAFPPNLLVSCIMSGMVCLVGFVAQSVVVAHNHYIEKQKENLFDEDLSKILRILSTFKTESNRFCAGQDLKKIPQAIANGLKIERLPQSLLQARIEVGRSFLSGIGKGIKAIGFTLYTLQEVDEQGRYHDTPLMVNLMVVSAAVHAIIFALRAYARGLGRPPVDAEPLEEKTVKETAVVDKQSSAFSESPGVGGDHLIRIKSGQSIFGHNYANLKRNKSASFSTSAPNLTGLTATTPQTDLPADQIVPSRPSTQSSLLRRSKSYSNFFLEEEPATKTGPRRASDDLILPSPYRTL